MATNESLLHEVSKPQSRHRLIIVSPGKVHRTSEWFKMSELGNFEGYTFATKETDAHPSGVFRTSRVKHQQLG